MLPEFFSLHRYKKFQGGETIGKTPCFFIKKLLIPCQRLLLFLAVFVVIKEKHKSRGQIDFKTTAFPFT
jgi:hypothetical protein